MADRTVKVRLQADISDFVTDIGVKAVAAVNRLERSATKASATLKKAGGANDLDKLGSKADAAGVKLEKVGIRGESSGRKISAAAVAAGKDLDKLADSVVKVDKATASNAKTTSVATKNADAQANALGRLRVAQARLADVQNRSNPKSSAVAAAEESLAAAERAVKRFEKAGSDSGKSFGAGFKKWLTGSGADLGKAGGSVFGSGFLGALKTPILGPAIVAILSAAVLTALPAVGAIGAGAFVTGFGAGIAGLGIMFAAQSQQVGHIWSTTMSDIGRDMTLLSAPFQTTLINIAGYFKRTVDAFNPTLAKAFSHAAQPVDQFVNEVTVGLERLIPAVDPLNRAFTAVLAQLGPALQEVLGQLSEGLTNLAESVERNPQALADMARGVGDIAKSALDLITTLNNVNTEFSDLTGGVSLVDVTMKGLQATLAPLLALFAGLEKGIGLVNALKNSNEANGKSMADAANHTVQLVQGMQRTAGAADQTGAALRRSAHETHAANVAAHLLATAFERQAAATQKANDALFRNSGLLLTLSGAEIGYQAAVDASTASVKENGRTHDITTAKGRANKAALDQVAASANAQTEASRNAGKASVAAATSAQKAYEKQAFQMGYTKEEAHRMALEFIKIPPKVEADFKGNITDLDAKIKTAKEELKDPKLSATKRAKLEATIQQLLAAKATAQAAIDALHGKSVSLTVTTYKNMVQTTIDRGLVASGKGVPKADGGYHPGGYPSYADGKLPSQAMIAPGKGGGLVQWAEQETGGEAFIPLAPSKRDRSEKILGQVASDFGYGLVRSFADGGFTLPGGRLVDIALILRQLGIPFDPASGVNYTASLAAANRANRAVVPARDTAIRADRAEQAAKAQQAAIQRAITLQQRKIAATRAPKQTTKAGQAAEDRRVAAEQAKLIKLQDQLYKAKLKTTAATKASNAADAVYKVRAEAAAKAAEAHKAAIEKLVEQQKAAVDLANQVASGLTQGSNIGDLFAGSLTSKGLVADLQNKGAELAKFGSLVTALRKQGLDETLIQQIVGKGAGQGTDIAQAILSGGLAIINALNKAQWNLEGQANLIGAGSAAAQYGVNVAGARAGGGGVSKGMTYRVDELGQEWFTAPLNGFISPANVDPRRYISGLASGAAGGTSSRPVEVHNHQHNTFSGVSMAEADLIAQRANAKLELMNRGF